MKKCLFLFLLLPFVLSLDAQVSGLVTDTKGDSLAFATVYIQGTSIGTTTNEKGIYRLDVPKGEHILIFQYVGYKQLKKSVDYTGNPIQLNAQLEDQAIVVKEVVIAADREDPAYPIIRNAIAKRKYYKDAIGQYCSKAYVKSQIKLLDAPDRILGQEIGDLGGILDSTRSGIVYLSESESTLYYRAPNDFKEVMISSKVSGDDQGFSFNEAGPDDFNFYKNTFEIGRNVISPIASNALGYYKYRLEGSFYDEYGYLINKIEVIPKNDQGPVFFGHIYIIEDLWNIHSTDLYITGTSSKISVVDTMGIRQVFVPIKDPDKWVLLSKNIHFKGGAFSFKFGGSFTSIFSDYDLEPEFEDNFFNGEIFRVNEEANKKDSSYWESIRPIPLTEPEIKDYKKKDSLQIVWKSKAFLDSIDRINNKFTVGNVFFGYNYQNSFKKRSFSFNSPISTIQFNTVQGFNLGLNIDYTQSFDEEKKRLSLGSNIVYGFSDKKLRGQLSANYRFDRKKWTRLSISGGKVLDQFYHTDPVSITNNTLYSLWVKENYLKVYEKDFLALDFVKELFNGVTFYGGIDYASRNPVVNTTDYSFYKKDNVYLSNDPQDPFNFQPSFESHDYLSFDLTFRIRLKQQYMDYPNRRFRLLSDWPDILIWYRKGLSVLGSDVDFDRLEFSIRKNNFPVGLMGEMSFNFKTGFYLNNSSDYFIDYFHFGGNQFIFNSESNYYTSFKMMPFYRFSTTENYMNFIFEHDFNGNIADKIPGFKKLGFEFVVGSGIHYVDSDQMYYEISAGLDNVGIGILRFLRLDYVWSFDADGLFDNGILIGFKAGFGN